MKLHELKIQEKYWNDIKFYHKKFELRNNDRDFQEGDLVKFIVVPNEGLQWTTNPYEYEENYFRITYVLKDVEKYGLKKGYCIFGFKQVYIKDAIEYV